MNWIDSRESTMELYIIRTKQTFALDEEIRELKRKDEQRLANLDTPKPVESFAAYLEKQPK